MSQDPAPRQPLLFVSIQAAIWENRKDSLADAYRFQFSRIGENGRRYTSLDLSDLFYVPRAMQWVAASLKHGRISDPPPLLEEYFRKEVIVKRLDATIGLLPMVAGLSGDNKGDIGLVGEHGDRHPEQEHRQGQDMGLL